MRTKDKMTAAQLSFSEQHRLALINEYEELLISYPLLMDSFRRGEFEEDSLLGDQIDIYRRMYGNAVMPAICACEQAPPGSPAYSYFENYLVKTIS